MEIIQGTKKERVNIKNITMFHVECGRHFKNWNFSALIFELVKSSFNIRRNA